MENFIYQITQMTGSYIPRLIAALAVLILGWIVALVIANVIRGLLHKTTLDNRVVSWIGREEPAKPIEVEKGFSKVIFYLLMLFVLVAFFQILGITLITQPLNNLLNTMFLYLPQLLGAVALALIAWIVARVLRAVVARLLGATGIDEKLSGKAGMETERVPLTRTFSEIAYWLVLLLFLPAILSTLGLQGLLAPVQSMLDRMLGFLPNIITAAVILLAGWFAARVIQKIVTSLLQAIGTERFNERVGLDSLVGKGNLSYLIGQVIYVLVLIPVIVATLNALRLDALTVPASRMLEMVVLALPNIFAAALILVLSFIVARIVANFVLNILESIGFNKVLAQVGVGREIVEGRWTPAAIVSYIVFLGIMLFAVMEASNQLGFTQLSELLSGFLVLAGRIILGLVIFGVGLFLANLISGAILTSSTTNARLLATAARVAILVLAAAMGLRQMGLANEIINLAFGLIVGAIAVAVAIAAGLGGRDIAHRELEEWVDSIKSRRVTKR
jgi:flagellar biosynthesis protein FliQ